MNQSCPFPDKVTGTKCPLCNFELTIDWETIPYHNCKELVRLLGLGDFVQIVLLKFGITKERWARFTRQKLSCGGCDYRQAILNYYTPQWLARFLWILAKLLPWQSV